MIGSFNARGCHPFCGLETKNSANITGHAGSSTSSVAQPEQDQRENRRSFILGNVEHILLLRFPLYSSKEGELP